MRLVSSTSCLLRADDGDAKGKGERRGEGYHIQLRFPCGDFFVVSFLCSQNEDSQLLCHIKERQIEWLRALWSLLILMTLFRYLLRAFCVPDPGLVLEVDPLLFHWAGLQGLNKT